MYSLWRTPCCDSFPTKVLVSISSQCFNVINSDFCPLVPKHQAVECKSLMENVLFFRGQEHGAGGVLAEMRRSIAQSGFNSESQAFLSV